MARPLRIQFPGALYHLINRGNERKPIFRDDTDRRQFLALLRQALDTYSVILHGYVLMNNHWHMLAQTSLGNVSEFMRYFNISYTSYFNRRHNRSGHLYQGRYNAYLVEEDAYLSQVSKYIHLNPVRVHGMKTAPPEKRRDHLFSYRWSSLPGYIRVASQEVMVTYDAVLEDYGGNTRYGRAAYKKEITEDLVGGLDISKDIVGQAILGTPEFVSRIKETYLKIGLDRERPALRQIHRYIGRDTILDQLALEFGITIKEASITNRQIIMTMLYKYGGMTNKEIGSLFNCDYSTVSQGRKRLRLKVEKNEKLRQQIAAIENSLSRIKI
jgi:putative transposase